MESRKGRVRTPKYSPLLLTHHIYMAGRSTSPNVKTKDEQENADDTGRQ